MPGFSLRIRTREMGRKGPTGLVGTRGSREMTVGIPFRVYGTIVICDEERPVLSSDRRPGDWAMHALQEVVAAHPSPLGRGPGDGVSGFLVFDMVYQVLNAGRAGAAQVDAKCWQSREGKGGIRCDRAGKGQGRTGQMHVV